MYLSHDLCPQPPPNSIPVAKWTVKPALDHDEICCPVFSPSVCFSSCCYFSDDEAQPAISSHSWHLSLLPRGSGLNLPAIRSGIIRFPLYGLFLSPQSSSTSHSPAPPPHEIPIIITCLPFPVVLHGGDGSGGCQHRCRVGEFPLSSSLWVVALQRTPEEQQQPLRVAK